MGLGGLRSAWQRQTKDFGHTHGDRYSVLVLDNIGIGESDKPFIRYSTSNMARDVLEVLSNVGWTDDRSVHVVGVSMGGMIAQELAYLAPNRVASLMLVSTGARIVNTVGFLENLRNRINLFIPKSLDRQIAGAREMICTTDYLEGPDVTDYETRPFPTGGDRFGAGEVWKRSQPQYFTRIGFIGQAIAAGWHYKSEDQLRQLAESVGRERIVVVHGTEDRMITVPHGEVLAEELSRGAGEGQAIRKEIFQGQGHSIPTEKRQEFHALLEDIIDQVDKLP